jgi:hypothetical protein
VVSCAISGGTTRRQEGEQTNEAVAKQDSDKVMVYSGYLVAANGCRTGLQNSVAGLGKGRRSIS